MTRTRFIICLCALLVIGGALWLATRKNDPTDLADGRAQSDFVQTETDAFDAMDGGIVLTANERKGRNTWILWTGGNEQFWDRMSQESYGVVDLLKTIDSRERFHRFKTMGLINEPGLKAASKPDEFGLWIDEEDPAYQPTKGLAKSTDPKDIDPLIYGRPTGIIGLRLYPNPKFNSAAKQKWDASKYYKDQSYYLDPELVRPYRIGMSCAFCHVAPAPLNPPNDPENPRMENLASIIGNQYFREGAVFGYDIDRTPDSFMYQLLRNQPPGTSDTSRIATDHINNPNAMNAIFNVGARLGEAVHEEIVGGALNLPGGAQPAVPHILKDGADSVGVAGATIRVYVNIGMFHQQWIECHQPLIGLRPVSLTGGLPTQKPFDVAKAHKNSVYWRATEDRLDNIKAFFLRIQPMHLADAPGGAANLNSSEAVLRRGKIVFAENCAECHSSKRPPVAIAPGSKEETDWYRQLVLSPDFLENNFLSDDQRHSVTEIGTNASRAVGTNAAANHVWDNFSSNTYKDLPSAGSRDCPNPCDPAAAPLQWKLPAGGPGYYRTPSLISVWSSAPFLHNNSLGTFTGDPSIKGRMEAFNDAFDKLLWPAKRDHVIWRTDRVSYLIIPKALLPDELQVLATDTDVIGPVLKLGPIPSGTPVNLLANIDPDFTQMGGNRLKGAATLLELATKLKADLLGIKLKNLNDAQSAEVLKNLVPLLMQLSKCPDYVEDEGHEFGSQLSDDDKNALREFLKSM